MMEISIGISLFVFICIVPPTMYSHNKVMPQCLIYKLQNTVSIKKELLASGKDNAGVLQVLVRVIIPVFTPNPGNAVNMDFYRFPD